MSSIEIDRAIELANCALHDAIVRVPGGSRIQRGGTSIKPFGAKLAADLLNKSVAEIHNMADPTKTDHLMHAEKLHRLLLEGMDPAWLEEVARSINLICIKVPDISHHASLQDEVLRCGKEFGDVCSAIACALDKKSERGSKISARELAGIHREIDEAVGQLYELLAAVESEAAA